MKHRLGRIATTLALLAVTGLSTAGTAAATPPDRFTLHIDDTFPSGTSEDCGFDILLHLEGSMTFTDFYDRDGELVRSLDTYPALFYTFINAATGASVTSRSPDPEHYTWNPDGSFTLEVTGLVMNLAGSDQRAIQAGRFVITVDPEGNDSATEPVGRSDDYHAALCEILAP
jgi:hypothetical protein